MPRLRRRVNKASDKLGKAKKQNTSVSWMTEDGPAGSVDFAGMHREITAEKKYKKAMKSRSKSPVGAARKIFSSKDAKKRLANIQEIRRMRKKGYVIKTPKRMAKYDESTKHLIKDIPRGARVKTVSKRGNVREGELVEGIKGFVFIKRNGEKIPLKAERLKSVEEIK